MSLLDLQRDFRLWLQTGDDDAAENFPASARPGLGIYQNNYRSQLAGCLEESFPVTLAWLGGQAFHAATVAHVEAVPPSSWTLDLYGRDFPATLRHLYPDDPEVGDLASLEHALGEAFVADDSPPLAMDLAFIDWDRARFRFVPSLAILPLSSNAPAIWSAIIAKDNPPPAVALPEDGALIVWRTDERCQFRSIGLAERDALAYLSTPGTTFGSFCNSSRGRVEEIGQWLGAWIANGLIAQITEPNHQMQEMPA